ncbi:ABC transporter ATP-binding protein [Ktedonosporobacter rubrisoli]|uniref:ABC-type quaternary amine transporter n=1 Tax=Ktedonosporobacter rubrisoli TaxID=2509675 RepID=A0A4P6JSX5_KTERU|nr:ABC transporter ATP-binding protein [Ktedonosporobacter rubrisoli]QBD78657.1 ABC transporter ATP-binding protein [Ktedonosporobacter rubrisoli]
MITITNVSREYAARRGKAPVLALQDISLQIQDQEFVVVVGPSGCGKTTLLNLLAGFEQATSGQILFDGKELKRPGAERGIVFQQATLYPWLSVYENIALGLKLKQGRQFKRERVHYFLETMGLQDFAQHPPYQLSGGMQQRVAIARALIVEPKILLMDEPFGALDAQTRSEMQQFLLGLWEHIKATVFFITHDVEEAILLADRIVVMTARPGSIAQEITVTLPRPRAWDIALTEEFLALKREVLSILRPGLTHLQTVHSA